jgi:crossover junction endodeoxyribonuclease RusA
MTRHEALWPREEDDLETPLVIWTVELPFQLPRSLNDRRGFWAEAKSRAQWLEAAVAALETEHIPPCKLVRVRLHYYPKADRRRDPDNLVASYKPCVDATVVLGIVPDDTQEYVERVWPVIMPKVKDAPRGRFTLIVEQLE